MNTTVGGRSSGLIRAVHLESTPAEAVPISTGGLAPWQKRRVMDLLTRHLAENISVRSLAGECGLSASHFGRAFKASFGLSAHRWFVERRIERSKELLLQTHESLVDVADQTGFADQAAFTRTFRRLVGVSPGRWRRYQTTVAVPIGSGVSRGHCDTLREVGDGAGPLRVSAHGRMTDGARTCRRLR